MGQGFHIMMRLLTMVQIDMGQGFHTLMSLLNMMQMDMGCISLNICNVTKRFRGSWLITFQPFVTW